MTKEWYEKKKLDEKYMAARCKYNREYCRMWRKLNAEKVKQYNRQYRELSK